MSSEDSKNPYLNARKKIRDYNGSLISKNRTYQFLSIASGLIAVIAVCGSIYVAQQSKFVPYIVEVDNLGRTSAVSMIERAQPVDPRIIKAQLTDFIFNSKSVTSDLMMQEKLILDAYAFIGSDSPAINKLQSYHRNESTNPFHRAADNNFVDIEVESILPQSEKTWQIAWNEKIYNKQGELINSEKWTGNFIIEFKEFDKNTNESDFIKNPLGLFVNDFNWTKNR